MAPLQVLVFSATADNGYRHDSIPAGVAALQHMAISPLGEFDIKATEDAEIFTQELLSSFDVIVLLQTAGDFLSSAQLNALKGFMSRGGGVVAIHGASTGMPNDATGWYERLVGASFEQHPEPQSGVVHIVDAHHPIVSGSLQTGGNISGNDEDGWQWRWHDEWYNFKTLPSSNVHVLLAVDEESYTGGEHGEHHPIAWCQEVDGGRSFYTALGHFDDNYQDPIYMAQIRNAILWVARRL